MPSVTQRVITDDRIISLEINHQTDFAKGNLLSLSFFKMSHITCLSCIRTVFVFTVITKGRGDCQDYIGERNEPEPICYIGSLIYFYSRIATM